MQSSGMLHCVALVKTNVSEECSASIISVTRIRELGTLAVTIAVTATLMMEALCSSETSVLTRATWCNIPGNGILHSNCRENLKSYTYQNFLQHNLTYIRIFFNIMPKSVVHLHCKKSSILRKQIVR
jgi:hypothetical protein